MAKGNTKKSFLDYFKLSDSSDDDFDDDLFDEDEDDYEDCLLYTSPSPRDGLLSRMPSSA